MLPQMRPTLRQLARSLRLIGALLEVDRADYCFDGRFRFDLHGDWSLVVSADDAERLRLQACLQSSPVATLWCPVEDTERLRRLVQGAYEETAALAA